MDKYRIVADESCQSSLDAQKIIHGNLACYIAAMDKYRIVADESCQSLLDAQKIIHGNLVHVINIKHEKLGFLE
jgi:L-alanine-DL-glutamate epimerase-like enolase superfamily enzyme